MSIRRAHSLHAARESESADAPGTYTVRTVAAPPARHSAEWGTRPGLPGRAAAPAGDAMSVYSRASNLTQMEHDHMFAGASLLSTARGETHC